MKITMTVNPNQDMAKLLATMPDILKFLRYVASGKRSAHDAVHARALLERAGQWREAAS